MTCPSTSCCGSGLGPSANRTFPASTHPRSLPLPLVRLTSGHPAWGTLPRQGRAHGWPHQAIRAHAGQYVARALRNARFPTVLVRREWERSLVFMGGWLSAW